MSTFLCKNGVRKEYFLTPTFIIEPEKSWNRCSSKIGHNAINDKEPDDTGQDIFKVPLEFSSYRKSLPFVCFFDKAVEPPPQLPSTEKGDDKGTYRKTNIADKEVFHVHDRIARPQGLERSP